jgi:tetratricopeptide (TPR) repeat protein
MVRVSLLIVLFLFCTGSFGSPVAQEVEEVKVSLSEFDKLWDYGEPGETEQKFRALLPEAIDSGDPSIHAELLTQIARTLGLQRKFDAAHETLDQVEGLLTEDTKTARVRYLLERGRVFNSSKEAEKARSLFLEAWELAKQLGEDFHAVDAAHMMGIIEPPEEALAWNQKAIEFAEQSTDERAQGWLGSLYNNVGWTYHDQGSYEEALAIFEKALAWRQEKKQEVPTRIAKWCVARALRSIGRTEEALEKQQALLAEYDAIGESSGYVHEELGECLLLLDRRDEAQPHFAKAFELLSKDPWFVENEADRLARLKGLGGIEEAPADKQ